MKSKRFSNLLKIGGLLMITAALCITGVNFWQMERAAQAADRALSMLQAMPVSDPENARWMTVYEVGTAQEPEQAQLNNEPEIGVEEIDIPDYVRDPYMPMPVQKTDGQEYIGVLEIPALELKLPVIGEWSYSRLQTAPCRYIGSAYLDNLIIMAHNYAKHFGNLLKLQLDDDVYFTDMAGNVFCYRVCEVETLARDAVEEMAAGDWDLTLFTCTIGGRTRVTIRCAREK